MATVSCKDCGVEFDQATDHGRGRQCGNCYRAYQKMWTEKRRAPEGGLYLTHLERLLTRHRWCNGLKVS